MYPDDIQLNIQEWYPIDIHIYPYDIQQYPKLSIQISSPLSDPPATAAGIDPTICTRLDYPSVSSLPGQPAAAAGMLPWARGFAILYTTRVAACMPSLSLGRLILAALRHSQNQ